jgi:hypothetical protein
MKIDHEYLKKMLEAFESSPEPTFLVRDFKAAGIDHNEDAFVFHLHLLADQGFVVRVCPESDL